MLRARLPAGARICLGLSGGVDSIALLHVLHVLRERLDYRLSAVHVHHGLSPRADAWAELCAQVCRDLEVPLRLARVRVEADGHGLEAAARRARYQVYAALPVDYVLLAHQQDDQAETVLLNLLRGTGVAGMAGMPVERVLPHSPVRLLRPLLDVPRAAIEAYARAQGLTWVEDEGNLDPAFARNHLRHRVLPRVAERFPAYRQTLARAARHFAECARLLDALAQQDAGGGSPQAPLEVALLARLPEARARNLLRWHLGCLGLPPWPERRLKALLASLRAAGTDRGLDLPAGEWRLKLWRGRLYALPDATAAGPRVQVWRGEASLPFAGGRLEFLHRTGEGIRLAALEGVEVRLCTRRGGERLRPDCRRPRRAFKQLCQELGIPPWERDRLPLLHIGERLAWAGGLGADCAFQAGPGEPGLVIVWHPAG